MKLSAQTTKSITITSYLSLILLILLWEGWLAPAPNAPPGLWLTLKSIPLLVPLRGLIRGHQRTYLFSTLLLLFYFSDGVISTYIHWPDGMGLHSVLPYAIAEWVLATCCFALALMYIKKTARRA